jgi:phage-related protein
MITKQSDKGELLKAIEAEFSQLEVLFSSLSEKSINDVSYKDSWTAAQLLRHIILSTKGMAKAMNMSSKPADRDPGEKIAGLKKTFLDLSSKMQSPDFIVPEAGPYEKEATLKELQATFGSLKENAGKASLNDLVEGLPFGPVTKLELLHFVLYHTMRHIHQMKKIVESLNA